MQLRQRWCDGGCSSYSKESGKPLSGASLQAVLRAFSLQYCLNPSLSGSSYILAYKLELQSNSVHAVSVASILVQLVGSCELERVNKFASELDMI